MRGGSLICVLFGRFVHLLVLFRLETNRQTDGKSFDFDNYVEFGCLCVVIISNEDSW